MHNILGQYCWTCQVSTVAGVPGWPKRSVKNDSPKSNQNIVSVTWLDGTRDSASTDRNPCSVCRNNQCPIPVHNERYKERFKREVNN